MKILLFFAICMSIHLGCTAQIYYVQDLSTTQIQALDRSKTVVLLPGGILEEHGPYLPSFTDGYMNLELTKQVANTLVKRPGTTVLVFPLIPLGNGGANEIPRKYTFSGSYTVRHNTLRAIFMDMGSEIGDQGFKKIFVIHMHGAPNHNEAIDQACAYFNDTYKGRMVNIWNLAIHFQPNFLTSSETKEDGFTVHAGVEEHSMLYFLRPEFLKLNYKEAPPMTAGGPNDLAPLAKKDGWPGYWGSPRLAGAALGEKVWTAWTAAILQQVDAVMDNKYDFSQSTYAQMQATNPAQKAVDADAKQHDRGMEAKQSAWLKSKGLN